MALVPETVKRLAGKDIEVVVEAAAGEGAFLPDSEYEAAGATIVEEAEELFGGVDLIVKVNAPTIDGSAGRCELDLLKSGSALVALLYPRTNADLVRRLAQAGVTAFSLDLMPRITRAQSMDVLSSMSTVAGYRAVLIAAGALPEMMPMLMTAAGTIRPAQALVHRRRRRRPAGHRHGAAARRGRQGRGHAPGRAGAGREPRRAASSRWRSSAEQTETAGGYAADLGEEVYRKQREILAPHVARVGPDHHHGPGAGPRGAAAHHRGDGRVHEAGLGHRGPRRAGRRQLRADEARRAVVAHGVPIIGPLNLPVGDAGRRQPDVLAQRGGLSGRTGQGRPLAIDIENEIVSGTLVTRDGQVLHGS